MRRPDPAHDDPSASSPSLSGGVVLWGLVALSAAAAALMAASSVALHWRFDQVDPVDKAYFLQRAWQAAFGVPPCRTVLATEQGAGLWAGKHLNPILAIYVPLIRWRPSMEMLLAGQATLLAFGAVPAFLLGGRAAESRTNRGKMGLLAALFWLTSPLVWSMATTDFRPFNLAAPFLLACWAAAYRARPVWAVVFAVAALSSREEVAWFLLASMPALWWRSDARRKRTVLILLALTAGWMVLTVHTLSGFSPFLDVSGTLKRLVTDLSVWPSSSHRGHALRVRAWEAFTYQFGATGIGLATVLFAPLAGLPAVANWIAVVYAKGLATPASFHYLAPTAASVTLAWPGTVRHLARALGGALKRRGHGRDTVRRTRNEPPRPSHLESPRGSPDPRLSTHRQQAVTQQPWRVGVATLFIALNLSWMWTHPPPGIDSAPRVLSGAMRPATRRDSAWPLILRIPPGAAVLTDDMFLPMLAARRVIYDADEILDPHERRKVIETVSWALLRMDSAWAETMESFGFQRLDAAGGAVLLHYPARRHRGPPPFCFP